VKGEKDARKSVAGRESARFGLMQRDLDFEHYQDEIASLLVVQRGVRRLGNWGARLTLVQLTVRQ